MSSLLFIIFRESFNYLSFFRQEREKPEVALQPRALAALGDKP